MVIKLPADLNKFELVGDQNTLGNVLHDSVEGVIDLKILTKEQAERLVVRKVAWLRKKTSQKFVQDGDDDL